LGTNYLDFLAEDPRNAERVEKIRISARNGVPWADRASRRSRDGREFELDIAYSPLRDDSGAISNYLAVERDVSLEVRVQQQLRQFQKIEALGTLAGGIAHDFNNILNPIFINTELALLGNDLDAESRRNLETVLKAAERGRDLVKQIITFSRQKERERKPSKVTPVLLEALKFIRASLPSTIEIKEDLGAETGSILSDPAQIHQVVMNLVNNAAYAMRDRGGVLAVRLAEVEVDAEVTALHSDLKPGSYLRLTVTDTGTGMKPEVMERAFDPFYTTKKPGEGSGMGLAVVHGIVKDQGGAITVYSEVGKGSSFNVFFPRLMRAEAAPAVEAAPPAGGRERILLVDDEAVQIDSVKNMLERLGYAVTTASNGEAALEVFRKDPGFFDLVITDQTMPSITGIELAKKLLLIRPGLPIVLCTGFSEIVDAGAAQRAGIRGFQMKPFSLREMAETVRSALKKEPEG
jgi:signal transduction histidine kinase/CheY-like chemotaxis protein